MGNLPSSGRETRPWAELPADIVISIATRLSSTRDRIAFGAACSAWRPVVSSTPPFPRRPPLIFRQHSIMFSERLTIPSDGILSIYYNNKDYKRHAPGTEKLTYLGTWFSHLILAHPEDPNSKVILLNIYTGAQTKLPPPPRPFGFASLSADPTSPNCRLVVVSNSAIQYLWIGDGRNLDTTSWTVNQYPAGIIPPEMMMSVAGVINNRVYAGTFEGRHVYQVDIDTPPTTTTTQHMVEVKLHLPSDFGLRESDWKFPVIGLWGNVLVVVLSADIHYQFNPSTRMFWRKDIYSWGRRDVGMRCVGGRPFLCSVLLPYSRPLR